MKPLVKYYSYTLILSIYYFGTHFAVDLLDSVSINTLFVCIINWDVKWGMCIVNVWFVIWGAIGDVDGDGTLDLISIVSFSAKITDEFGQYMRTQKMTRISKTNLELQMRTPTEKNFVSLNSSEPGIQQLSLLHFQATSQQPWTAYLGTHGDSSYRINWISFTDRRRRHYKL